MLDNFRFETFVDVHSNIFAEYLSSVIAKLPKDNPEYRSIEERIEELYKEYPKVMEALDTEKPSLCRKLSPYNRRLKPPIPILKMYVTRI